LANPYQVVEIQVSGQSSGGEPDMVITSEEAKNAKEASLKIQNFLKEKKILMGHNYSI
jgi:bifunctional enzyme CysN/CysC